MNTVNFQASVNNVVQMDRFQQDASRTPVVNQSQNAVIAQDEAEKRIRMPVEAEQAEGKKVDPQQRKHDKNAGKRKHKKEGKITPPQQGKTTTGGFFVDVQA
jgi:hypothetical protein